MLLLLAIDPADDHFDKTPRSRVFFRYLINFVLNFSGVKDEKTLDMIMILHNYA